MSTETLDVLLEKWAVHAPGTWDNEDGPKEWYAVSDDDGTRAYFIGEADACRWRMDMINKELTVMGTDIHCCAEILDEDGKWTKVGRVFPHSYYDPNNDRWNGPAYQSTDRPFYARNYDLFSILADVRNGSGFAGVDTGDGFNVISLPRGLPDNLDKAQYRWTENSIDFNAMPAAAIDVYENLSDLGDHSFSWLLVKELLDFDWDQTTKHRGWVTFDIWKKWHDGGRKSRPGGWSGGISGPEISHMIDKEHTPEEIIAKHEEVDPKEGESNAKSYRHHNLYIQVEWTETYRESVGELVFESIDRLKALGDPEKVRIVFGFDS